MPSGVTPFIQLETTILVGEPFNTFKQRDDTVVFESLEDQYGGSVNGWIDWSETEDRKQFFFVRDGKARRKGAFGDV